MSKATKGCDRVSGKQIQGNVVRSGPESDEEHENVIHDEFHTLEEVSKAIRKQGLDSWSLILGIDYTLSNITQGQKTFEGRSLHEISDDNMNPYQMVIGILGHGLVEQYDDDGIIPVFGFGDQRCKDKSVFELVPGAECDGFYEVEEAYKEVTPTIKLGGPTDFAPLIEKAIEIVQKTSEYHILLILTPGQMSSIEPTKKAIIEASHYPLSIVVIGVGDGPWGLMETFDDGLKERLFDNFQFVNYHKVMKSAVKNPFDDFVVHVLMEIPEQYKYLKQKGLVE